MLLTITFSGVILKMHGVQNFNTITSWKSENVRQKKKAEGSDHSESEEESNKAQKQEEEEEEEEEEDEKDSRRRKRKGRWVLPQPSFFYPHFR